MGAFRRREFLGSAMALGATPVWSAAAAAPASAGAAPPQGPTPRYRFINLSKIQEGWSRAQKMLEEYREEFRARAEALAQKQKELQKMKSEADSFASSGNTPAARKRLKDLATALAEAQFEEQELKRDRDERRLRILLSEYQSIQEVAGKWAQQNGVDAVFTIQEEDPADDDLQARYQRAVFRQVLWHSKELDATDAVLKLLEASAPTPTSKPR